ncbi:MAG: hypothetical protein C4520_16155 [Candidatus Abyssobacteria bacterium SURF_5]|uniref:GatB/YqeY domain-containing protein n=1 Tax=Abyssobacteria bacterium (strain SURF_5) TaxID=2093360 RepID=A0A3A4ND50_ABYX5|nr:MAG: hypothetical protein C4520_16155 [Candidatus Abyssubacteria bacterium SURF_5]
MHIKEKVEAGIKEAMKSKDQERLSALRMIKADLLLKEKETGRLDDAAAEQALQKMFKKYKKAKEEYESLGKHDEARRYERDLQIIEQFMSAPMMEEGQIKLELQRLVEEMQPAGPQDFGKIMKSFMAGHKNVEGKLVSSLLKEILDKKEKAGPNLQ